MFAIRRCCALVGASAFLFFASFAWADDELDIRGWLDRPGVKLLAVEFYATWCKPCMDAIPRWKKIHESHRKDGLRLVVVSTQDPEGGCANPGWNPDAVICDDDGSLAKAMNAQQLPAAFLWSWQGNLLVRNGLVEEVEEGIQKWIHDLPRVDVTTTNVSPEAEISSVGLRELVRAELARRAKITLVATEQERKQLHRVLKASFSPRYDQRARCDVGKELPPNSVLQASIIGEKKRLRLRLGLLSLEQGCLIASALVGWDVAHPEVSVAESASKLLHKLRTSIQMPRGDIRSSYGGHESALVSLMSEPIGATVLVDDKIVCQTSKNSCDLKLSHGLHSLKMRLEGYVSRVEQIEIESDVSIHWQLKPKMAALSIRSQPSKLMVMVDGQEVGVTPLVNLPTTAGAHLIRLADPCYQPTEQRISLGEGAVQSLDLASSPRMSAIDIGLQLEGGAKVTGVGFVDGRRMGPVPGVYTVPLCSKSLEIEQNGQRAYRTDLSMKGGVLNHVTVVLPSTVTTGTRLEWVTSVRSNKAPRSEGAVGSRFRESANYLGRVALFRSPRFTYFREGSRESEAYNISATLKSLGYDVSAVGFPSMSDVYSNRRDIKGLVIPEMDRGTIRDLHRSLRRSRKYMKSYVAKGGTLVMSLDMPSVGRSLHLLRTVFGWKGLKSQNAVGQGRLISAVAQSLQVSSLPPFIANNSDTDVVVKANLPRGARALYEDDDGQAMVLVIPVRRGRVVLLGWDWYDAQPAGRNNGGWVKVLDEMLK